MSQRLEFGTETYSTILFDLDHTLLDSDASERAAFAETMRFAGLEPSPHLFQTYTTINHALWRAVERGETTPDAVAVDRFEQFAAAVGLEDGPDPPQLAAAFTAGLGGNGELYPGARDVLEHLAGHATLAMVTNGLSEVQRARIDRLALAPYFSAVVISAEVGTSKPGTAIFDLTFAELGEPDRTTALMIGDSLTSDIRGGLNAGIDTCWYNSARTPLPEPGQNPDGQRSAPHYEIADLKELLVLGG